MKNKFLITLFFFIMVLTNTVFASTVIAKGTYGNKTLKAGYKQLNTTLYLVEHNEYAGYANYVNVLDKDLNILASYYKPSSTTAIKCAPGCKIVLGYYDDSTAYVIYGDDTSNSYSNSCIIFDVPDSASGIGRLSQRASVIFSLSGSGGSFIEVYPDHSNTTGWCCNITNFSGISSVNPVVTLVSHSNLKSVIVLDSYNRVQKTYSTLTNNMNIECEPGGYIVLNSTQSSKWTYNSNSFSANVSNASDQFFIRVPYCTLSNIDISCTTGNTINIQSKSTLITEIGIAYSCIIKNTQYFDSYIDVSDDNRITDLGNNTIRCDYLIPGSEIIFIASGKQTYGYINKSGSVVIPEYAYGLKIIIPSGVDNTSNSTCVCMGASSGFTRGINQKQSTGWVQNATIEKRS